MEFGESTNGVVLRHTPAPILREIPYIDPLSLFSRLYNSFPHVYLLESVEGPQRLAEYSFIGFKPLKLISVKEGEAEIRNGEGGFRTELLEPLAAVRREVAGQSVRDARPRFAGGAVGYFSYDTVRYWEDLPKLAKDDLTLPEVEVGIFDDGVVFDHRLRRAYYFARGEDRFEMVQKHLACSNPQMGRLIYDEPRPNVSKSDFEESVRRAKKRIFDGDAFQVVLSKRLEFNIRGSLIGFYAALRSINPSPYMYFLKFGDRQIVGSSPEMLARVEGEVVETFPIAGTRPRVHDQQRNSRLTDELLKDTKERAEHVMLVDLARNDVGRVSEYGSVKVPEFMTVHQYSHVQHIVSRVVGRLSASCDSFDVLRAMLPAGTVSGAPKPRAMEIIEELEPVRRGPYGGAVGYFSYNGNADFAITIRTLVVDKGRAYIQAGAGVVADSDPETEWVETERKAEALLRALQKAGETR